MKLPLKIPLIVIFLLLSINIFPVQSGNFIRNKQEVLSSKSKSNFVTPSGNIYCSLTGEKEDTLRCEIKTGLNPLPPQPYQGYCEFDWGLGFLLSENDKAEILCISDTIAGSTNILPYNQTWEKNNFHCVLRKDGLKCLNLSGKGFFLSRERWSAF